MSILYNTNSSLIPKFQRHNLLRGEARSELKETVGFPSKFEKNSDDYLKELCCSVWTAALHTRIDRMDRLELTVNSLAALIFRNYVGWYGTKIPTNDDQFPKLLFDLIQDAIAHVRNVPIDYENVLGDELPLILSKHVKVMRQISGGEQQLFRQYCRLTLYQNEYPQLITKQLKAPLKNGSLLQSTFLDALFDDLILGKIMDRVLEPYYILHAITKLNPTSAEEPPQSWSMQKFKDAIASLGRFVARMTSVDHRKSSNQQLSQEQKQRHFLHRYIFIFLFEDLSRLHYKKPGLFAICKTLQYWATKSRSIDKILHNLFYNLITARIVDPSNWQHLFLSLRQVLFPKDGEMGPGTDIPVGEEFEALKIEARNNLWQLIRLKRLDLLLGMTLADVEELINVLSKDKRCNKLLCFRIIDCLLAQRQD